MDLAAQDFQAGESKAQVERQKFYDDLRRVLPNYGHTEPGIEEWIGADQEEEARQGSPIDKLSRRVRADQAQAAGQAQTTSPPPNPAEQNRMDFPV